MDVINPDLKINIKVNKNDIYLFANKIVGAGGFPVGSSGKVLLLLSGGIDSPVAAYKLMKRGLQVQYLHFATPLFTLPADLDAIVFGLTFNGNNLYATTADNKIDITNNNKTEIIDLNEVARSLPFNGDDLYVGTVDNKIYKI